jgi:NADPH:quinone reductase and related Zn-dependent oxidoreductases
MKTVRIHDYGSWEALRYEEASTPQPNEEEVLIKIHAASVNHLDLKTASGAMASKHPLNFPWTPGQDFSGIIEAVGSNVSGYKKGDEVYGNCFGGGSYAEYIVSSPKQINKKPEHLSLTEAASVPHVAQTAWEAVHTHGEIQPGQKVLIHGAAGAVGAYAVQFAHDEGAKVYGTCAQQDKAYLKELGADVTIDYKNEDFTQLAQGMDLIIDLVGGETQTKSYGIIRAGGRLVSTVGIVSEEEAKKYPIETIGMVVKPSADILMNITDMFNDGKLKFSVSQVFPLKEASEAWKTLINKGGKIILQM